MTVLSLYSYREPKADVENALLLLEKRVDAHCSTTTVEYNARDDPKDLLVSYCCKH